MLQVSAELVHVGTNRRVIQLQTSTRMRSLDKRLSGATFSGTSQCWQMQLSLDACYELRSEFGDGLVVGPVLSRWARTEIKREKRMRKLGRKSSGVALERVPELYPPLAAAMAQRPYQTTGALFIARGRSVLIADTPGLGKTMETLAGVVESGVPGPYLVIAPIAALETVWEREIRLWMPEHVPHVISAANGLIQQRSHMIDLAVRSADADLNWVITNAEAMRVKMMWVCPACQRQWPASAKPKSQVIDCGHDVRKIRTVPDICQPGLFGVPWGAVIIDESHNVLVHNGGYQTQVRAGAVMLPIADGGLKVALSGTPMRGNALKLWGTLNWLRPKEYSSRWTFIKRFWNVEAAGFGGALQIGARKPEMEERLAQTIDSTVLRRTKAEVAPELPRKQYMGMRLSQVQLGANGADSSREPIAVWLKMDPKQRNAYEQMQKMGVAELESGTLTAIGSLAVFTRLKQFANSYGQVDGSDFTPILPSNKLNWLLQFLDDMGIRGVKDAEPQGKVVIGGQFRQVLLMFQTALTLGGITSRRIDGAITAKQRTLVQDQFNDPQSGINVLFLQTQSGGASITLDAADDMVVLDETPNPDDQTQLEDRIDNRRPEEKVAQRRYWYLKSLGTVEEAIARVNYEMDTDQRQLLDGRRGVAYAKSVVAVMKGGGSGWGKH